MKGLPAILTLRASHQSFIELMERAARPTSFLTYARARGKRLGRPWLGRTATARAASRPGAHGLPVKRPGTLVTAGVSRSTLKRAIPHPSLIWDVFLMKPA